MDRQSFLLQLRPPPPGHRVRKTVGEEDGSGGLAYLFNAGLMHNATLVNADKLMRQKRLVVADGLGGEVFLAVLQHKHRIVFGGFQAKHFLPREGQGMIVAVITGRDLNSVHGNKERLRVCV